LKVIEPSLIFQEVRSYLVHRGITPESAKVWLDQSVNAKAGYEENYNKALKRWKEISALKK
jgi:hypothetical protein